MVFSLRSLLAIAVLLGLLVCANPAHAGMSQREFENYIAWIQKGLPDLVDSKDSVFPMVKTHFSREYGSIVTEQHDRPIDTLYTWMGKQFSHPVLTARFFVLDEITQREWEVKCDAGIHNYKRGCDFSVGEKEQPLIYVWGCNFLDDQNRPTEEIRPGVKVANLLALTQVRNLNICSDPLLFQPPAGFRSRGRPAISRF